MDASLRVAIFGKQGCDKCRTLQHRVEKILATGEWPEFEKAYCDIETEEGLVLFCRLECANPNRIPALAVLERDEQGAWRPMARTVPGAPDAVGGANRLYAYVGLQTDYSAQGKGVIPPAMIRAVLEEARALRAAAVTS